MALLFCAFATLSTVLLPHADARLAVATGARSRRSTSLLAHLAERSAGTSHADAESAANPIRRVVTMLQKMAKKVEAEGEEEEALYEKFSCYCKTNGGGLTKSIAEGSNKIPQVQSDIESSESELAQLKQDLKSHQDDRSAAKAAMEAAIAQRGEENKVFVATSTEYKSYIDALKAAIPSIQKGMTGGLLQARIAASSRQTLRRAVSDAMAVTDYDRQLVTAFLAGTSSNGYVPQSGEIVGILQEIQENFEKSLADVESSEASAVKLHEELMAAKSKQVAALTDSIESKTLRSGEVQVAIVNKKEDLSDTEAALAEDQKFAADLKENCDSKAAEYEERKKTRAEELVAIHDTIKVLNDDDALDLFKKTLASPSFLQVEASKRQVQLHALDVVRHAQRASKGRPSLDFLALALSGKEVDFSKVLNMIDEMVEILGKEQLDDDHKKEYCATQIDATEDKGKELSKNVEDLDTSIAELEETMATLASEIKQLTDGVSALDKEVAEAYEQRVKEHAEYQDLMKSNSAAKDLLGYAKNRLNKFYNPDLATTTPAPELSREDQLYTSFGGTLAPAPPPGGIAGTGVEVPAALVQLSLQTNAPPPPPETWGAYSAKTQETTGVISMIDMLIKDLDKEMTEAETSEKNAQKEYEQMTADAQAKRAADTKAIAAKEGAKAEAEMDKVKSKESADTKTKELMATKKYEMELHQDCDWLAQNYDLRKEARASEVDSLKSAKAILSGSDFSLAQARSMGSRSRH